MGEAARHLADHPLQDAQQLGVVSDNSAIDGLPFVQVSLGFLMDWRIPQEVRTLMNLIVALGKGKTTVAVSQREIRRITGWSEELISRIVAYIAESGLAEIDAPVGGKRTFSFRRNLLRNWVFDPGEHRGTETAAGFYTRSKQTPRGASLRSHVDRMRVLTEPDLFAEPSASGGHPNDSNLRTPSAGGGDHHPLVAEVPSASGGDPGPSVAEAPSAGGGDITKKEDSKKETAPRTADDAAFQISIDDACDELRTLGVTIYPHEVGVNDQTQRRLTASDLGQWITWVKAPPANVGRNPLKNPKGWAARAIREGRTVNTIESSHLAAVASKQVMAERKRTEEAQQRAAEEQSLVDAETTNAKIAALPPSIRQTLRRSVLKNVAVWNLRDTSETTFARMLASVEHAHFRGSIPKTERSTEYDYSMCKNAAYIAAWLEA